MAIPSTAVPTEAVPMPRAELDGLLGLTLTDEQWDCVSAPMEPFVIVAGAGTGKTAVMAARVLWLVASGYVAEHEVLGLTFTNKAAAELAHRVTTQLNRWRVAHPVDRGEQVGEPTIATYHAFARRLIEEQGLRVGIEPGARLFSGAAVAQLAYRIVCRSRRLAVTTHGPVRVASDVVRLDANLAEQTISTDELRAHDQSVVATIDQLPKTTKNVLSIRDTALRRLELADLVDELREARRESGGLDFSDHMRLCAELVASSDELVAGMRQAYRVVLLDEYQDTSIAQRVILSTLFSGTAVTAVGDPMQAIYGWRSASVANIDAFATHFSDGSAPIRVLSVNRRSGTPILEAANRISDGLRAQHPQVARLRPPGPAGATVRAALLPTIVDEREWIADQVRDLVLAGTPPEHIAILGRSNDQLGPLQMLLTQRGVPAAVSGVAALTTSPYATAVLATLRVLADPGDNTSVVALLAGARWRIGTHDLHQLGARAIALAGGSGRGRSREPSSSAVGQQRLREELAQASAYLDPVERPSLLEAAADPGSGVSAAACARLATFRNELRVLQGQVGTPLADLVGTVLAVTGARVEADLATGGQGIGDVGLAGLLHLVEGFSDAEGRTGLGAFLAYLDAAELLGAAEDVDLPIVPGSVQLMTMHKAKGLEFPVVVLPHVCRGSFPGGKSSERWTTNAHVVPSELRDDRHVLPDLAGYTARDLAAFLESCRRHDRSGDDRLAYVAVTRAQQTLIATGHWWGETQIKKRGPSDYLESLREQSTGGEGADPWAPDPEGTHAADSMAAAVGGSSTSDAADEGGVGSSGVPGGCGDPQGIHGVGARQGGADDEGLGSGGSGPGGSPSGGSRSGGSRSGGSRSGGSRSGGSRSGGSRSGPGDVKPGDVKPADLKPGDAKPAGHEDAEIGGTEPLAGTRRVATGGVDTRGVAVGGVDTRGGAAGGADSRTAGRRGGSPDESPALAATNPMLDQVIEVQWPAPDQLDGPGPPAAARAVTALLDAGRLVDPWERHTPQTAQEPGEQSERRVPVESLEPSERRVPVEFLEPSERGQLVASAKSVERSGSNSSASSVVSARIAGWDATIQALLDRVERGEEQAPVAVLPSVLSASAAMEVAADPEQFAETLLRPMPRRRNPSAELGTAFHAWVEARLGVQPLITDDDLPGAADESLGSVAELLELKADFEQLEYAGRTPAALEVPFAVSVGGRLVRGRIDAVFPAGPDAPAGQLWEVVDWKTSRADSADPLQLAIYRLAWAELRGVPIEAVGAAFAFIRSGTVFRPADLPDAAVLEELLAGAAQLPATP